jgi:hypothetical protein
VREEETEQEQVEGVRHAQEYGKQRRVRA